jgi:plasmid stability protein
VRQLTVRGFDDELSRRIRRTASRDGTSLNKAVLKLLRRGAGLSTPEVGADRVGSSLDHLIGTWSSRHAGEVDAALERFEAVDEEVW